MAEKSTYTRVTEEMAETVVKLLTNELDRITNGESAKTLELAKAYFEMKDICKEIEKTP